MIQIVRYLHVLIIVNMNDLSIHMMTSLPYFTGFLVSQLLLFYMFFYFLLLLIIPITNGTDRNAA